MFHENECKATTDKRRTASPLSRKAHGKERAQFIFGIGTKKRLERIARHYGYLSATALIEQWAAQVASEVAEKEEQKAKKEITTRYKHNA